MEHRRLISIEKYDFEGLVRILLKITNKSKKFTLSHLLTAIRRNHQNTNDVQGILKVLEDLGFKYYSLSGWPGTTTTEFKFKNDLPKLTKKMRKSLK